MDNELNPHMVSQVVVLKSVVNQARSSSSKRSPGKVVQLNEDLANTLQAQRTSDVKKSRYNRNDKAQFWRE